MRTVPSHLKVILLSSATTVVVLLGMGLRLPGDAVPRASAADSPKPAPPAPALKVEVSPEEEVNIRVYREANRGVVNVTTRGVQVDDFLFLTRQTEGSGSGAVLDRKGHIVTNYHVIEEARQVTVTLFDGSTH